MPRSSKFSPRRLLGALLVLVLLVSPSGVPGIPTSMPAPVQRGEEPSALFSWAMSSRDLQNVVVPAAGTGGWHTNNTALSYRPVPSFTSDPTLEVIVAPPASGHPTLAERFMIQYPRDWGKRRHETKAVVVGFHSFSVSEKDIFLNTDLPFECQRRGWMLIAPFGLKDENFANVSSQDSLQAILMMLYGLIGFNHERVYGVGFSMGGLGAVSYAMRHQNPDEIRFAGVVNHTGTVDMVHEYNAADAFRQLRLRNPNHFGASPATDPFAYERVSPALILPNGLLDEDNAPVANSLHIPFFFHANLADPNTDLLAHSIQLKKYLSLRGATVYEDLVVDPVAGHSWSTLPTAKALDSISRHQLPSHPPVFDVSADDTGRWLYAEVLAKPQGVHSEFLVEVSPYRLSQQNSFALSGTKNVDAIRLRLWPMGLNPRENLLIECSSVDGTNDSLILRGFATAPQEIRFARVRPSTWTYDAANREVRIRLNYGAGPARILIRP